MRGEVKLEGGWRVYSSGAGIGARLILQCFLGLRLEHGTLVIDPVMPPALDGLAANLRLGGRAISITYRVQSTGCGPRSILRNGRPIGFAREPNPYRPGGARLAIEDVFGTAAGEPTELIVCLG
jgi:cellobiose phosphorylase